jgi:glutamate-1-semialdehyde 2,1-aminomutase
MRTPSFPARSDAQTALVARTKALIPGGSTNSLMPPDGLEFLIARGEGAYVYDADGRRFLDFMLGAGPLVLGHAHPRIVETLSEQAQRGTHYFGLSTRAVALAERFTQYIPCAEMVRFTSSGSEATFHSLRLARAVTGRQAVIKFDGAWHGHHDLAVWSMELSPTQIPEPYAVSSGIQRGVKEEMVVLPYNDIAAFRAMMAAHPNRFAAVICEPMQRTLTPLPGFLQALREECDRYGTVLIFDEVVSGFRIAPGGAQEKYGVTPDLTALGKALSGGMPLSAVVGRRWLMEHLDPSKVDDQYSFHCGTFNGLPASVECAHTTIDMLVEEGGIGQLAQLGVYAREEVGKLFKDLGVATAVTGDGPIFHFYFTEEDVHDHAAVRRSNLALSDAMHRRLYTAGIYKQFSKAYLSLAHTRAHVDELCDMLRWSYRETVAGAEAGAAA